jgi:TonB family protein
MPIGLADRIAGYVTEAYKSLPRRGAEAGGLLLGGVRLGPVIDIFVTGFEPVTSDYIFGPSFVISDAVLTEFRTASARHPAAEIIGYYRSHTRKGSGPELSDQEIVDKVFPGLSGMLLLIKPSGISSLRGSYYFFQNGRLEMRPVGPDFPFLVTVPGGTPPAPQAEEPTLAAPVHEEPVVQHAEHHEVRRRRRSLQWEIIAAGLMIAAALALLWWQYRGASGEDEGTTAQSAPSHVASLGLAVSPGEGGWRITWDPNSPAARSSVRGILNITEDSSHERIALNPSQIQNGATTYRPIGDDIAFRLDFIARDNSLATETYRVIVKPREEEASAPRPAREPVVPPKVSPKAAPKPEPDTEEKGQFVDSEVVDRVAPDVPDGIRPRISEPLPIDVRVSIDTKGRVTKAIAVQHADGLVDYLGKRAVAAARQWTFTPAKRGGKPVESTRTIHFVFEQ